MRARLRPRVTPPSRRDPQCSTAASKAATTPRCARKSIRSSPARASRRTRAALSSAAARHAARHGVPSCARRADARRQRPAQPRDVRHDVDGAASREAHGRDVRQEHDRQGRVPAHRRPRAALREHAQPLVERAARRGSDGHVDDRVERSGDARRHGLEVALAGAPAARPASRPTGPTWSWARTCRWCGRSSAGTGKWSRATCRWKATATT